MGDVYRKRYTKPIPDGAEIVERNGDRIANWKDRANKTRTAPIKGDRISLLAATYIARYRDGGGIVREVATGCRSEAAARKVLSDLERRAELVKVGLLSAEEDSAADHLLSPIASHVDAYLQHLQSVGVSDKHRENVKRQLNRVIGECGFDTLGDLDRGTLVAWLNQQTKMAARTRNTYLAAAIAFCNWCCDPDNGRLASNPFARIAKADEKAGKVRKRRAMTEAELIKLLDVAKKRPLQEAMTVRRGKNKGQTVANLTDATRERLERLGLERALIYKTLVLTGLRKNELATLTVGQLELDGPAPHAQLDAADEKNREGNAVALRADLVADLRAWLDGCDLPHDAPIFNVPDKLIKILNRDLKAAGIPKKDERGRTLDVHCLRHSFSTLLSKGGVAPRTAQAAMRHSSIELTMNVYTDPKLLDVQAALNVLPALPLTDDPQREMEQADPRTLAPGLARNADKGGKSQPIADKIGSLVNEAVDASQATSTNTKGTPQTTCSVPWLVGDTGLEPVTPSLSIGPINAAEKQRSFVTVACYSAKTCLANQRNLACFMRRNAVRKTKNSTKQYISDQPNRVL